MLFVCSCRVFPDSPSWWQVVVVCVSRTAYALYRFSIEVVMQWVGFESDRCVLKTAPFNSWKLLSLLPSSLTIRRLVRGMFFVFALKSTWTHLALRPELILICCAKSNDGSCFVFLWIALEVVNITACHVLQFCKNWLPLANSRRSGVKACHATC